VQFAGRFTGSLSRRRGFLSAGAWIIVAVAVVSSIVILCRPQTRSSGLQMWTTAREHMVMYTPLLNDWNAHAGPQTHPAVNIQLFSGDVLQRRMMSGFLSDVPVSDLIEVERSLIGPAFGGPLKDVGFVDLTDRLKAEGLYDQFNAPSFSPWSSRGHIFGLPHDVHPVLLGYRADILEAAGIDMSRIQTWDDFAQAMQPLLKDTDSEGRPRHYPLNLWYTSIDQIETLVLQASGPLFDISGRPVIDTDSNAHALATMVSWMTGPNRISVDAQEFTASGNQLRLDGYVVCSIMPDWLGGVWKNDIPGLSGKLKLIPLPAWTPGGRRTSVWGGTMLGLCKASKNFDRAWDFAKQLYLNKEIARQLYETNDIISPLKKMWDEPFYSVPDPFFCGQVIGRMYIAQAPHVPSRTSSPYNQFAKQRLQDAAKDLYDYATSRHVYNAAALEPEAHAGLRRAQTEVQLQIDKNVFLASSAGDQGSP
jgi:arabinosaccharide transport system substrate-binding protein